MNILILNRSALVNRPYRSWLGPEHRLILLTDARPVAADPDVRRQQLDDYDEARVLERFHDDAVVELDVIALHDKYQFDSILALGEFDLLRAARLREFLGIPGASVAAVTPFRDKLRMKQMLQAHGVPVTAFDAVSSATDLVGFVRARGYPVVVKPRRGGGSAGVVVLHNDDDLRRYVAASPLLGGDYPAHLLVEAYVEHELLHVDGILVDGTERLVWPSSQGDTSCLGALAGAAICSGTVDVDDPRRVPVQELTLRALTALAAPPTTLFHAEIFQTADGSLVFNEVGCRMGGGRIEEMLQLAFGISLPEVYVKAMFSRELPTIPATPTQMAGLALVPPRPGRVVAIPDACPVPGVADFRVRVRPGDVLKSSTASVESVASALVTGARQCEVSSTLDALLAWTERELLIEP